MKKTYQVRYNTNSTDDKTSWRLICDGEEILVSDIYITAETHTTKDFVKELNEYKYHISCTGYLLIKDNVAYITCLLYTSPSPRDKRQSRMPSSA